MELLIIDKSGWSMPVKIQRATTRIGSASSNDVQLQSPQIAALHLQIFYSPDSPSSCKVVNMASEMRVKANQEVRPLTTFATLDIHDGDEIMLGDYKIKLTLPMTANVLQSTKLIEASLLFADPVVRPEFEALGYLKIKNAGSQPNCQFQVDVEGLAQDCYQIDPIPLMYPGAQEEVRVLIIHHGQTPPAGPQQVLFKITAPESYPGERCVIQQSLFITPVFEQSLELIDDVAAAKALAPAVVPAAAPAPALPADVSAAASPSAVPAPAAETLVSRPAAVSLPGTFGRDDALTVLPEPAAQSEPAPVPTRASLPEPSSQAPLEMAAAAPERNPIISQPPAQPKPDFTNFKVVHGPGDEFWNEL